MMITIRHVCASAALSLALVAPGFASARQAGPITSAGGDAPDAKLPPELERQLAPRPAAPLVAPLADPDAPTVTQALAGPRISAQSGARFAKSINFRRLVVAIAPGQSWGVVHSGRFCLGTTTLTWTGGAGEMKTPQFIAAFRSKVEARGVGSTTAKSGAAVYNLYGLVTKLTGDFCLPQPRDKDAVKGKLTLAIEWRFYSPLDAKPTAVLTTNSDYKQRDLTAGGVEGMLDAAFAENLNQLLDAPEVRQALAAPRGF